MAVRRRHRELSSRDAGRALAAIFAGTALWLVAAATRVRTYQADEDLYVQLARYVGAHFPDALWALDPYSRGLQRLESWMLAVPEALLRAPASITAGHALDAIAWASTCVPVYLLSRQLQVERRLALAAAALAVAVPWAVLATSLLTEPLAYPALCWLTWGVVRALVVPSPGRSLAMLGLLVLAVLCRTNLLAVAPVLPVVVAAHARGGGDGRATIRAHWPLWAAVGIAALGLALSAAGALPPARRLTGTYGSTYLWDLHDVTHIVALSASRLVLGTGVLAAILAVPWLLRHAVRPADRAVHAFALTTIGFVSVQLVTSAAFYAAYRGPFEERYIVYGAPLLIVGAIAAAARGEVRRADTIVVAVLAAILAGRVSWGPFSGPGDFFSAPVQTFHAEVLGGHEWLVAAGVLVAGVLVAVLAGRRARLGALVAAGCLQAAMGQYALGNYVAEVGARSGPSKAAHAWVDEALPDGAEAGIMAQRWGGLLSSQEPFRETQFWNGAVTSVLGLDGDTAIELSPGEEAIAVTVRFSDGRLVSERALPPWVVVPRTAIVGLEARTTVRAPHLPLAAVELAQPPRATWRLVGDLERDGWTRLGGSAAVHVFRPAGACLELTLRAPPNLAAPQPWKVQAGAERRTGALAAGATTRVRLPLGSAAGRRVVRITAPGGGTLDDGRAVTLLPGDITVAPCP